MKKTRTVRTFLAGMLAALLVVAMIPSALAAAGKTITVYPGISIYIDDQKLEPKDANGKPVEVFTYNGTTYLPVRAIAEALGKSVSWDGKTQSVYLGKHGTTQSTTWLPVGEYISMDGNWYRTETKKDNLGNVHQNCLYMSSRGGGKGISYALNGQYRRLTGTFFRDYNSRSNLSDRTLEIYGDGNLLWSCTLTGGDFPVEFDVNVTGVLALTFKQNSYDVTSLGDLALWD